MIRCSILLLASLLAVSAAASTGPAVIGVAADADTGALVYREFHYFSDDGRRHRVEYRLPDGALLAVKRLDYDSGWSTPSFIQENQRYGTRISVTARDRELAVSYRPDAATDTSSKVLTAPGITVVDAGFDHFIRDHWGVLTGGERVDFDYLAPSRQSMVQLVVTQQSCDKLRGSDAPIVPNDSAVCFAIDPANWLLRLLVARIDLVYDRESRRLAQYRGLSNVVAADEKYHQVDIVYRYARTGPARSDGNASALPDG